MEPLHPITKKPQARFDYGSLEYCRFFAQFTHATDLQIVGCAFPWAGSSQQVRIVTMLGVYCCLGTTDNDYAVATHPSLRPFFDNGEVPDSWRALTYGSWAYVADDPDLKTLTVLSLSDLAQAFAGESAKLVEIFLASNSLVLESGAVVPHLPPVLFTELVRHAGQDFVAAVVARLHDPAVVIRPGPQPGAAPADAMAALAFVDQSADLTQSYGRAVLAVYSALHQAGYKIDLEDGRPNDGAQGGPAGPLGISGEGEDCT